MPLRRSSHRHRSGHRSLRCRELFSFFLVFDVLFNVVVTSRGPYRSIGRFHTCKCPYPDGGALIGIVQFLKEVGHIASVSTKILLPSETTAFNIVLVPLRREFERHQRLSDAFIEDGHLEHLRYFLADDLLLLLDIRTSFCLALPLGGCGGDCHQPR